MRRFATIVLVLLLGALPAAAGDRHERDRGRHGSHADDGYRLAELAKQFARDAHRVHERAEGLVHHEDWREVRALAALHRLDVEAGRFRQRVERGYLPTAWDLDRLMRTTRRAGYRIHDLHANKRVERDFARVEHTAHKLQRVYAKRSHASDRYASRTSLSHHPWFQVAFGWRY